jgi:hypothetical protein
MSYSGLDLPSTHYTIGLYLARVEIKARLRAQGLKPQYVPSAEITQMARELLNEELVRLSAMARERCAALSSNAQTKKGLCRNGLSRANIKCKLEG